MAGIDWGVIALKNGKIMPNKEETIYQGAGGMANIGPVIFDRTVVFTHEKDFIAYYHEYKDFNGIDFYKLYVDHKRVLNWGYKGINFKTKALNNECCFLTMFKYHGDFYHILQGYDISLNSYWHKSTKKLVEGFLKKGK